MSDHAARDYALRAYRDTWGNPTIPEFLLVALDKALCKGFKLHGTSCRGRMDHVTPGRGLVHPNRWLE